MQNKIVMLVRPIITSHQVSTLRTPKGTIRNLPDRYDPRNSYSGNRGVPEPERTKIRAFIPRR